MKTNIKLFPLVFFLVSSLIAKANNSTSIGDSTEQSGTVVIAKKQITLKRPFGTQGATESKGAKYRRWTSLGYSGYIRSYNQFRHLPVRYANQPTTENLLTLNGLDIVSNVYTGYQEPLFLLRLEGSPTVNTNFKLEYAFDHQMVGTYDDPYSAINQGPASIGNRRVSAYRILQFQAGANTKIGNFKLIAGGGVNWYRLSPFTMWNYEYRDDMFERYPWEPEGAAWGRYNKFYGDQNIARDARWGNTGTQGFILEARNLPKGFGLSLLYGKTDNSGGFQSYLSRTPKNMASGRLDRKFGKHLIGANYFSQFGFMSTVGRFSVNQQIATVDARLNFDNFKIYTEVGIGRYQDSVARKTQHIGDSTYTNPFISGRSQVFGMNYNWAPAINFNLETSKELTLIPLSLQLFYVDKSVVNVNSAALNSSNPRALANPTQAGTVNVSTFFPGAILDIGQMTNNRMGAYLKHEDSYGKLKVTLSLGASQELENMFDTVSFWHRANSFTRSRFVFFQQYQGPYGRIISLFRRTYESIGITDNSKDYKKGYSTLDFSLKYKFKVLQRELILANYNNYNSVQRGFKPIPVFSDKAFVRTFYEELMAFYAVHPKVTLVGFVCYEKVWGNEDTELADANGDKIMSGGKVVKAADGKTINQSGEGWGLGLDYDFSGRAGIFLRHRWFSHRDKNFTKDHFRGMESTVELKIFF